MTQMTTNLTTKFIIKSSVKWISKSKAQLMVQEGE